MPTALARYSQRLYSLGIACQRPGTFYACCNFVLHVAWGRVPPRRVARFLPEGTPHTREMLDEIGHEKAPGVAAPEARSYSANCSTGKTPLAGVTSSMATDAMVSILKLSTSLSDCRYNSSRSPYLLPNQLLINSSSSLLQLLVPTGTPCGSLLSIKQPTHSRYHILRKKASPLAVIGVTMSYICYSLQMRHR